MKENRKKTTCGIITINTVDITGETINDGAKTIGGMTLTQMKPILRTMIPNIDI